MSTEAPAPPDGFLVRLRSGVGGRGAVSTAAEPVSPAAISAWCAVMSETGLRHVERADGEDPLAPMAMLDVWTMVGFDAVRLPERDAGEPQQVVYQMLDDAGFGGVVATNSNQAYVRTLRPGDIVSQQTALVDVSSEKQTALGVGHFVTTQVDFTDADGVVVGTRTFTVFRFRPGTGRSANADPRRARLVEAGLDPDDFLDPPQRPERPRPRWNQDQAWHWEGLRERELRIQRFTDDGRLVHPPATANPVTHAMDWDWIVASGRGVLHSWTVVRHRPLPVFDRPPVAALVELEEGVRLVSNVVGVDVEDLEVGMPLEVCWLDSHEDVTLHQFRAPRAPRRTGALDPGSLDVGDRLPGEVVEITVDLVVEGARATRDPQDVHHDRVAARAKGVRDIFMNIMTTNGLVSRWIGDWAGDQMELRSLEVGLGVPLHPGDLLALSGSVEAVGDDTVTVVFAGHAPVGTHVTGRAVLGVAGRGGGTGA